MQIKDAIKEQRIEAGMTLQYVQNHTGISNQNLSRWENGQAVPGVDFCIKLAKFYGCTLDELVGLSDYTPTNNAPIPAQQKKSLSTFDNEFKEILTDNNFIQIAKLFKAISPELRALTLGYLIGLLQNQGINTQQILRQ